MNPNEAIAESNGANAFPNPYRTAFYDKENNLWRQATIQDLAQTEDIRNKGVRPDVYLHVKHAVSSTALPRPKTAPAGNPDYDHTGSPAVMDTDENGFILAQREKKVDPIAPAGYNPWVYHYSKDNMGPHVQWHDREKGSAAPQPDPRLYTFAQDEGTQPTPNGEPEKVHVLEPMAYKNRADTNTPNTRTTFYNARHGVWMEEQPIQMMAQKEGDTAKEKAADEAKRADNEKDALAEKSAAAAKVGETSEKVSIIEPMAYERRSNYNTPFMRTTFYAQHLE